MRHMICYYLTGRKLKKALPLKAIPILELVKAIKLFMTGSEEKVVEVMLKIYVERLFPDFNFDFVKEVNRSKDTKRLDSFRTVHLMRMIRGRSILKSDYSHMIMDIKVSKARQAYFYKKYSNVGKLMINMGVSLSLEEVFLLKTFYKLQKKVFGCIPHFDLKNVLSFLCQKPETDFTLGFVKSKSTQYLKLLDFIQNESDNRSCGSNMDFSFDKDFAPEKLELSVGSYREVYSNK